MASCKIPGGDLFIPVMVDGENVSCGVMKLLSVVRPAWSPEDIKLKTFTDGITNKLIGCQLQSAVKDEKSIVLIRIYGNKTDLLIDRKAELRNLKCLNAIGLAPEVYGVFENGLIYEYCPGATLNVDTVVDPKVWPLVARQLARMHKAQLSTEVTREPMVWDKIEQLLCLLPEPFTDKIKNNRFVEKFGSITRMRIEFEKLKTLLSKTKSPIVFAHNDLLLGNVIYNQSEKTISFIDYEYAAYNYQAFDIANHFNEFVGISVDDIDYKKYPSKNFQLDWIKVYLREYLGDSNVSEGAIEEVFIQTEQMSLASHFIWAVWALVQCELSSIDFDFLGYAEIRMNRYIELKDNIFKQLL